MTELALGIRIPTFSAYDQDNNLVKSTELGGNYWVLFFYPRDFSKEGTLIVQTLKQHLPEFDDLDVLIMGFSPTKQHVQWMNQLLIPFPLIYDSENAISMAFGAYRDGKTVPACFLIDRTGVLIWQEVPLQLPSFVKRLLRVVTEYCA